MASQNEIQFAISLKNDASATLAQFKNDAESAMKVAGAATENYSKKSSELVRWIKEERMEQRQHNFIFQQTQEVVNGASMVLALYGNTLGQTNETQKMLTDSMNAGFIAFQGVNNVIGLLGKSVSFLEGPWGIVISLVAAGAVAMQKFNGESEKNVDNMAKGAAQANKLAFEMGEISRASRRAFLVSEMQQYQIKLRELNEIQIDYFATVMSMGTGGPAIYKGNGTPEEIQSTINKMNEARKALRDFDKESQSQSTEQSKISKMRQELELLDPKTEAYRQKLAQVTIAEREHTKAVEDSARVVSERLNPSVLYTLRALAPMETGIKKVNEAWKANAATVKTEVVSAQQLLAQQAQETLRVAEATAFSTSNIVNGFMDSLKVGMQVAFTGGEAAGKQFFKSLANTAINFAELYLSTALATAFAKGVPSFGATLPADFALVTAGTVALETARGLINTFHEGGTMSTSGQRIPLAPDERPAILRVGETVRTKEQEAALNSKGSVVNIVINGNGLVPEDIKRAVQLGMKQTGLAVDKYFVNNRSKTVLA